MIKTLKEREKEHIREILERTQWDLEKTAHLLRITVSKVERKIREHGLNRPDT